MRISSVSNRGNLSLAISLLALLVALSGPAYAALGQGAVKAKNLANGAVKTVKIRDGAVTSPKIGVNAVTGSRVLDGSLGGADLADGSVDTDTIVDRTIRLHDLGGGKVNQTRTLPSPVLIPADGCGSVALEGVLQIPPGLLGSMVVGTITTSSGGAVLDNSGFVLPTLITETKQVGAITHLGVCGGGAPQTIPAGSIVTWSVIAP